MKLTFPGLMLITMLCMLSLSVAAADKTPMKAMLLTGRPGQIKPLSSPTLRFWLE